ncbi:MAG: sugar ABC transporter ATP-binding protein [Thermoleophilaceae bacterium]
MSATVVDAHGEPPLAAVRDVHKRFGGVAALSGVTLEIHSGEVHCLLGENGAGKSTVVKLLSGVHKPDAGTVDIRGRRPASPRAALELGVSTIYQELTLVPDMTVAENISLGDEPTRHLGLVRDRRRLARRAREALDRLGIDGIAPNETAGALGIAQQQMVEIAKAVSRADEQVLILDEPTAPLAPAEAERLFEIVDRLRERGLGILYITHRLEELPRIGTHVTVMRDGSVTANGRVDDLGRDELIELMVGRKLTALYPQRRRASGRVVAEVVPKRAEGGEPPMTVRAGEVVALFGLVGAGRTELVRSLIGADPSADHRLLVDGRELRAGSPAAALRRGVGMVPEDRKAHGIVPEMSVATNISLSSLRAFARHGLASPATLEASAAPWAERLRVRAGSLRQPVASLSGGNQQKCVLARVLAAGPRLIVLDEPTRGIDVGARAEVYALVDEICRDGTGVLMITSDLPEALGVSDRIYVMRKSRIVAELVTEEATERDVLRLAIGATAPNGGSGEEMTAMASLRPGPATELNDRPDGD